jgi:hypothetical protein
LRPHTAKYIARRQLPRRTSKLGEPQLLLASSRIPKQGYEFSVAPATSRCLARRQRKLAERF